jgi:hypothetical protein
VESEVLTSTEDSKSHGALEAPTLYWHVSLVGGTADGLPRCDDMCEELGIHRDHETPDEIALPDLGEKPQQRHGERRLCQTESCGLEVQMDARERDFGQAAWDEKSHHEPGHTARGEDDEDPAHEEHPVVRLSAHAMYAQSGPETKAEEDCRYRQQLQAKHQHLIRPLFHLSWSDGSGDRREFLPSMPYCARARRVHPASKP